MMSLRTLAEKIADVDVLREMIGFAAQRLMELEVAGLTGNDCQPVLSETDRFWTRRPALFKT